MTRHPNSKPSEPHVQLRLASMKSDLDSRRLPGESYSHTVRWILTMYFDMMRTLDEDGRFKGYDSWYDADLERRDIAYHAAHTHKAAD